MRIITSLESMEMIDLICSKFPFKNKAQLLRIAISKSLKNSNFYEYDYKLSRNGFEINSDTLFSHQTELYLTLIGFKYLNKYSNDYLLNDIITFHIEDGVQIIYDEMKYLRSDFEFIKFLQEN